MHLRNSAFFVAVLALALPLVFLAQTPPPAAGKPPAANSAPPAQQQQQTLRPDETPIFTSDTRLVVLPVTVADKNGHLVTNLTQGQFQVFEDGVPQQIRVFKREDVPISLGLIIDSSGSMRDKRARVESAALTLVRESNRDDEVFVVNFNDEAFLDQDFTSDIKKMEQGLARIDSRGGTAMRDAIRMSLDHVKEKAKRDKHVLLVVTDGDDNASMINLENLIREAQEKNVVVYSIGLLSEEEKRAAKRAKHSLLTLTEATGGMAFFPRDVNDVEQIAREVAHDIRNQYTIGYSPQGNADGSYHTVKVTTNAPGRPAVRTRTGYYATRENLSSSSSRPGSAR
jgi:VWFA-related protein